MRAIFYLLLAVIEDRARRAVCMTGLFTSNLASQRSFYAPSRSRSLLKTLLALWGCPIILLRLQHPLGSCSEDELEGRAAEAYQQARRILLALP